MEKELNFVKTFYTKQEVKKLGFTEKGLSLFLPEPDRLNVNPRFKGASIMKL